MADFEDATTPTWQNLIEGQKNLYDAVRRTISFEQPGKAGAPAKKYALNAETAVLFVRPRGWHLPEKHLLVDGQTAPGALVDFGLFFFHNAKEQIARGAGPFFYLPKMESHLEARLWNDVFLFAQDRLGIPRGTIKATCLIETLPGAFEMDEFLYELREHSAGLNCGRWDYIFSFIKKRANDKTALLARSRRGHDGQGVPRRLRDPPHRDLPPPRCPRDGRHGRADPDQERSRPERAGAREGARGQAPRGHEGPRRHLGRAPGPRPDREGDLRRAHAAEEPARQAALDEGRSRGPPSPARGQAHGRRAPPQHPRRHPVPRGVAPRSGLRPDLRPDGRRRDRGDSRARRSGSGSTTPRRSTTARSSPPSASSARSPRR